ncbi:MAG: hypothetical protein U0235_31075 [Polyangiaceae bacterium]
MAAAKDFDPLFVAQTIEVAKSDPKRVYVSGSLGDDGAFYVSTVDGGTTFTKHVIALVKPFDERAPLHRGGARPPTRAIGAASTFERAGAQLDSVTDDGAVTFRSVFQGPPLAACTLCRRCHRLGGSGGRFARRDRGLRVHQARKWPSSA